MVYSLVLLPLDLVLQLTPSKPADDRRPRRGEHTATRGLVGGPTSANTSGQAAHQAFLAIRAGLLAICRLTVRARLLVLLLAILAILMLLLLSTTVLRLLRSLRILSAMSVVLLLLLVWGCRSSGMVPAVLRLSILVLRWGRAAAVVRLRGGLVSALLGRVGALMEVISCCAEGNGGASGHRDGLLSERT